MKPISLLLLPILTCMAHADTIRMRDGSELTGEVVTEKDDHYVVKVQVTKTIRDERKIPKKDILEIVAEKKDLLAFEEIKSLVPTPDLLTLEQYDQQTAKVENFMKEFPQSRLLKDADALLKTLDAEREVIAEGGLKFEGKMVQASDRAAHAYPLDARIAAAKVVNAPDTTQALRAWTELESKYGSSKAYLDAREYARKLMLTHLRAIEKSLDSYDQRMKDREAGLARIDERDRDRTKRAIEEQNAAYLAKVAKEKEENVKWPSLDPNHKGPMMETKRLLEMELSKLDKLDPSKLPDGDKAWNDAWSVLSSGGTDRQAASTAISAARSARLPAEYITILEAKIPE
ncbi:PTPDL family protein [Haloferula chungangensis]|uniref:PTPDL family protein n=1 Tax=Haloferula chungangensis TaxID=1048331 RepID=A0ABW2L483_9BACT